MRKLFYTTLVAFTLFTAFSSCKKDKKTTPVTPPTGAVQLWENVHIIDSTQWILFVNSVHPANGIYMYTFTPSTPNISVKVGDIIVGESNGGYMRKVTNISISGAYYYLQTSQATLADVFKRGSFNFQIPMNEQGGTGISKIFTNYGLFHNSNFALKLLAGQFDIQPNLYFNFSFDSTGLTNFQMSASNNSYKDSIIIGLKGVTPYMFGIDTPLAKLSISYVQYIQAWTATGNVTVPLPVKLSFQLRANGLGGSPHADTINTRLAWSSNDIFTAGLRYTGGQWQPTNNSVANNIVGFDTFARVMNSNLALSFNSQIITTICGAPGPQFTIGLSGSMNQVQFNSTAPFSRRTDAWNVETVQQTGPPVFGKNIGPFNPQTQTSDSVFFQSPYLVTKISGDNQTANVVSTLPQALVLKITDSNGQAVKNVSVAFTVTHGGGTLSAYNLLTDQNGLAQVTWALGPPMGNQNVTAKVFDGYGKPLLNAPAVFNATGQ